MAFFSLPFLAGRNPILGRELRQTLRNERAFALLAIYVSILGAVVASQFPADQAVAVGQGKPGSGAGYELFWTFCQAQAFFVVVVLPALAAGALAQERERGTLESFLLTPLSPHEIVWGKAAGVLCFGGLLLAATLPLTSLSFLLGGVSPMDIVTAYVVLLALAAFVTGFGLYCSARWTNAVRATVACYGLLPFALALLVVFMGPGSIIAGVALIGGGFWTLWRQLPRWRASRVGQKLGPFASVGFYGALALTFIALILLLAGSYGLGLRLFMLVFVTPYLLWVARLGLERTGDELARKREPEGPARQKLNDLREDWHRAVAAPTPIAPVPTPRASAPRPIVESAWASIAPEQAPRPIAHAPTPAPRKSTVEINRTRNAATYNTRAFLPDNLNPVFARDMRSGILRGPWLVRIAYAALILSQLWLVFSLALPLAINPDSFGGAWRSAAQLWSSGARCHLALVMIAGAIFGARALAPEREQQTLPQLLTTPLKHRAIVGGKLLTALVYAASVFALGAPATLLAASLTLLSLSQAIGFLATEIVLGIFAAAWGVLCSMRGLTARRALGWSLGGIAALLGGELVLTSLGGQAGTAFARALNLLPLSLVPDTYASNPVSLLSLGLPLGIGLTLAALFAFLTILDFKAYAAQV
ncbi:MAG TPA: ABC transporter permease subunit [Abditibacteriaceae bacterium]|jgi:ABC-type transport system involved in multi-copper enzyme maturation permease subunit